MSLIKKLSKNKIARGLVSLIAIIILLSSILAANFIYEKGVTITANVAKESPAISESIKSVVMEVEDIKELSSLNEGFYYIKNGYVYYIEHFDSFVPLYIKMKNPSQQNGMLIVEKDGEIEFDEKIDILGGENAGEEIDEMASKDLITGNVVEEDKSETEIKHAVSAPIAQQTSQISPEFAGYTKKGTSEKIEGTSYNPYISWLVGYEHLFWRYNNGKWQFSENGETGWGTDETMKSLDYEQGINALNQLKTTRDYDIIVHKDGTTIKNPTNLKDAAAGSVPKIYKWEGITVEAQTITEANTKINEELNKRIEEIGKELAKTGKEFPDKTSIEDLLKAEEEAKKLGETTITTTRVVPASKIDSKLKIDGKTVEDVKKDSSGKVTFKFEGTTYELEEDEAFDPKTKQVLKIRASKLQVVSSDEPSLKKENQIKEIAKFATEDLKPVYVAEDTKNKRIKIVISGEEKEFSSELLKNVKWNEWKGDLDKLPIGQGFGVISKESNGDEKLVVTYENKEGVTTKEEEIKILKSTGDKITKTSSKLNTDSPEKTEITKFKDGDEKVINFKSNTDEKNKVVYKTKEGKTLELKGEDYEKISAELGDNTNRILKLAVGEGFENVKLDADGNLAEGEKKIRYIGGSDNKILVLDGNRVVKESTVVGKEAFTKIFSGDIKFNGADAELGNGASYELFDSKGNLVKSGGKSNDGASTFTADYKAEGVDLSIETGTSVIGLRLLEQVNDPKSPVNRMYHFTKDGEDLYYDESVFGAKVYRLVEKDGKKVAVEVKESELSKNVKTALGLTTTNKRKHYENIPYTLVQEKSQRFFNEVERVLSEFQGLGYYATLFFDDDSLLAWRDNVDRIFANDYLGTEYWGSEICSRYIDGQDKGVAYAETPQGLAQVGAHIEATRTEPIITQNGREFIYKITFNVRNGDFPNDRRAPEEMNINVVLKGEKTATVFKHDIKIKRGSKFGKTGKNAIVQDSKFLFDRVCITFDNVPLRWKIDNDELCNVIKESAGAATPLAKDNNANVGVGKAGIEQIEIDDF